MISAASSAEEAHVKRFDACQEHTGAVKCLRFCHRCGKHCYPTCQGDSIADYDNCTSARSALRTSAEIGKVWLEAGGQKQSLDQTLTYISDLSCEDAQSLAARYAGWMPAANKAYKSANSPKPIVAGAGRVKQGTAAPSDAISEAVQKLYGDESQPAQTGSKKVTEQSPGTDVAQGLVDSILGGLTPPKTTTEDSGSTVQQQAKDESVRTTIPPSGLPDTSGLDRMIERAMQSDSQRKTGLVQSSSDGRMSEEERVEAVLQDRFQHLLKTGELYAPRDVSVHVGDGGLLEISAPTHSGPRTGGGPKVIGILGMNNNMDDYIRFGVQSAEATRSDIIMVNNANEWGALPDPSGIRDWAVAKNSEDAWNESTRTLARRTESLLRDGQEVRWMLHSEGVINGKLAYTTIKRNVLEDSTLSLNQKYETLGRLRIQTQRRIL